VQKPGGCVGFDNSRY